VVILFMLEDFIYIRSTTFMPGTNSQTPSVPRTSLLVSETLKNATGSIVSLQNAQWNKPHGTWYEQFAKRGIWLLSGKWALSIPTSKGSQNVTSPILDASFSMVMLNGTRMHKHTISHFIMIGVPIIDRAKNSTTLRGIATVTMNSEPLAKVPISITIVD